MYMAGAGAGGRMAIYDFYNLWSIITASLRVQAPCTWDLTEGRAKHNNNMLDSPHPPPPPPTEHWNSLAKPRLWSVLSWRIIEIRLNAAEGGGGAGWSAGEGENSECSKARPRLESNGIYQSLMRTSQEYNCCVCNSSCVSKAPLLPM